VMRKSLDAHIAQQARTLRERLAADLADGTTGVSAGLATRPPATANSVSFPGMEELNNSAAALADRRFQQDLTNAAASARRRRNEINRREAEDAAIAAKGLTR
jgi:hypothetical protein